MSDATRPAIPPVRRCEVTQAGPTIDAKDYARFQEIFYRKTGITFGDSKRYFVDRRLADRMIATGSPSIAAYLAMLQRDTADAELQNLVNTMTVNETYFDRESYQFRCLVHSLLPELVAGRERCEPVRIWSMPCSTGEEAYSIAIHLLDNWAEVDLWDIRLYASDIDTGVLERAREGVYDARAVQHLSPQQLERFFRPVGFGRWQVIGELRRSIEFRRANINSEADMRGFRDIDVIFCRNLLIYFDDTSRGRAIEGLHAALRPGGFMCLGHSETPGRQVALFTPRKFPDALVYQKPPSGAAPPVASTQRSRA